MNAKRKGKKEKMKRKKRSTYIWMRTLKYQGRPSTWVLVYRNEIHNRGKYFILSGNLFLRLLPSLYCIAPMFQIGLVLNCAVFCKPQVIYQKVLDAPLDIWYQKQNRKYILLFQLTCFKNKTNITDENLNLIPSFQSRSFEYISASLNVLVWLTTTTLPAKVVKSSSKLARRLIKIVVGVWEKWKIW